MKYKKKLALILFVIIFNSTVFANGITNNIDISRLSVFEQEIYETATEGTAFFLFSNITLKNVHDGSVIALFSMVNFESEIKGNVLSLYSDVTFLESACIDGVFFQPPDLLIKFLLSVFRILILFIIISFNKSFFEQGYGVCENEKKGIFKAGLTVYFFVFAMSLIFLLAVVTYPLTIILIFLIAAAELCGEVSLAMYVGNLIFNKNRSVKNTTGGIKTFTAVFYRNISFNSFANITLGGIIIECLSFIPYIGLLYSFLILPVICIGILCVTIINAVLYKKFYTLPYPEVDQVAENVRDILTEGL